MKYLKKFNEIKYNDYEKNEQWDNPFNPEYKDAFFDRGDEDEETWEDYGIDSIKGYIEWFDKLPNNLTIYRGLSYLDDKENVDILNPPNHTQGNCWTLDINVAKKFSNIKGAMFKGEINKKDVDKEYTIAQAIRYSMQNEEEISPIDNRLIKNIKRCE